MNRHDTILERIEGLLSAAGAAEPAAALATVEEALTSAYAHALALEAERWRIERQLSAIVAGWGDHPPARRTEELARLHGLIAAADGDLGRLRSRLAALRLRASALRAGETAPG